MKKKFCFSHVLGLCAALGISLGAPSHLLGAQSSKISELDADVVILGGGIGGLTSAIYLARSGLEPVVVEGRLPGGQITQSFSIQNWPGESEITGNLLTEKARKQAEASGAHIYKEEAEKVDFTTSPYTIVLRDPWHPTHKKIIKAKSCIIATGALPNRLNIPGESKFWSRGVHTCATCDGNLYKDQHVAVVGGGDGAIVEGHHLAKLASKVTVIVRGNSLKSIEEKRKQHLLSSPNVEVLYETQIQEIVGKDDKLSHLVLKKADGKTTNLPIDALFLAIGTKPNTDLFKGQLELDSKGYIVLQNAQTTSVPGVFAIGDVSDPFYRQAITAAGDGAKAALQAEDFLALDADGNSPKRIALAQHTRESKPAAVHVKNEPPIVQIKSMEQFQQEVLDSDVPVVVDFYADWCGPCQALSPHIDAWSEQFQGKLKFAKVNVENLHKLAQRYRVDALPTVLYFEKGGKLKDRRTGSDDIAELMDELETKAKR